jgi:hypothetical protein
MGNRSQIVLAITASCWSIALPLHGDLVADMVEFYLPNKMKVLFFIVDTNESRWCLRWKPFNLRNQMFCARDKVHADLTMQYTLQTLRSKVMVTRRCPRTVRMLDWQTEIRVGLHLQVSFANIRCGFSFVWRKIVINESAMISGKIIDTTEMELVSTLESQMKLRGSKTEYQITSSSTCRQDYNEPVCKQNPGKHLHGNSDIHNYIADTFWRCVSHLKLLFLRSSPTTTST